MEKRDAATQEELGTCELSALGAPRMKRERIHPAGILMVTEDMVEFLSDLRQGYCRSLSRQQGDLYQSSRPRV